MSEIDMIPREYREARRMRQSLRVFVVVFMMLPLVGIGAHAFMNWLAARNEVRLAQLRSASALAQSGSAAIDAARAHKAVMAQALVSLSALRGAGDAVRVADAIEDALTPQIRLDQVTFSRDAQLMPPAAAPAGQLMLPASPGGTASAEVWQLAQRLEISGVASGYPSLTIFIGKLSAQPKFIQVRLARSGTPAGAGTGAAGGAGQDGVIQFSVSAMLEHAP